MSSTKAKAILFWDLHIDCTKHKVYFFSRRYINDLDFDVYEQKREILLKHTEFSTSIR